ncbi:MAG: 3-hydroxyacyl-CoA dehydrogenase [Polyangiaceae bacterium]
MNVQDKVAIVTGGASGLGEATARAIVARGGRVAILDRQREAGEKLANELGDRALFVETDITSADGVSKAVEAAKSKFGRIDIAVSCAGVGTPGRILGKDGPQPLEQFEKTVQVNLIGTFNVLRLASASMSTNEPGPDGERGVIINTASVAAFDGQIGQAAYAASKGGVVALTLPAARELSRFGVRVMTIAPGIFRTPMLAGLPEAAQQSLGQQVPFPSRLGDPSEFAALVCHIVENTMLNGEVIRLDGALRMAPKLTSPQHVQGRRLESGTTSFFFAAVAFFEAFGARVISPNRCTSRRSCGF